MKLQTASKFVPVLSGNRTILGNTWTIQSAGKPWSYKEFGPQLRFERQPGDNRAGDPSTSERTELEGPNCDPYSAPYWMSFSFMHNGPLDYTPNPVNQWLVCGQFHDGDAIGVSLTPWLSQEFGYPTGGSMRIVTHSSASNPPVQGSETQRYVTTIQPYTWYNMVYNVQAAYSSGGATLKVWMNGVQILNLTGISMGYNTDTNPYYKIGIYCGTHGDVVPSHSIIFANPEVGPTNLSARITAPLSHT